MSGFINWGSEGADQRRIREQRELELLIEQAKIMELKKRFSIGGGSFSIPVEEPNIILSPEEPSNPQPPEEPSFTHSLSFTTLTATATLTKQSYSPSTQFFNFYHRRAVSISPTLATSVAQIPNIHLLEVYNVTKSVYLLDFSQSGHFYNNSTTDTAASPSPINKLGSTYSANGGNQTWATFYYGTRLSSNNSVVSSPGDIIRVRAKEYVSGNYGVNVVFGQTIAELYFLEDASNSYSSPTYPTIVDSEGNPV